MSACWTQNYAWNPKKRDSTCLKTFYLEGKSPWGFRIILDSARQLVIAKVRPKSKADLAGLKENDIILLINDISTQKLNLQQASDLIESAYNLCLFVLTSNNQEASRLPELNKESIRLENMLVNNSNTGHNSQNRILNNNPAFSKFQSQDTNEIIRTNKDSLLLKEIEPSRANYNMNSSIANYDNNLTNQHRARNKNYNLARNYYSAAESNGEEEYETKKFNTKSNFMQNAKNDEEKKQVSYASITLRKPLKDLNYFSDTEAFNTPNSAQKFRIRNSSNSNRFQKITASNRSLQQQQQQQKEKQQQFIRSNSSNSNNLNTNANIYNNHIETDNLRYNTNNLNTNYNIIESNNNQHSSNITSSNQIPRSSVSSLRGMFNQANIADFNRQTHGFSKLSNFYGDKSPQSNHNQQQPQIQKFENLNFQQTNKPKPNVWSPPPVQPQHHTHAHKDEPYEDPIEARYEREMGSELAKPSSKNYSDSYFYNSTVHNYPTIDDQKKLAKSIVETLEGSNPETSKYHLKKQKFQKQLSREDYESEGTHSAPYYSSGNEFFPPNHEEFKSSQPVNSYVYDETLPDIIKRSIAQASMNDPVRLVVAPDSFKSQHYTEHTTHTQMPPKAAMSLAAALESNQSKGGRGAQIFQKRKEKSEKWVVDETNVKRLPGQIQKPKPQPQVYQPKHEVFEPKPIQNEHKLDQFNNQPNSKFSDFNQKAKGWGNNEPSIVSPINMAIDNLSHEINREIERHHEPSPFEHHPNRIDVSPWNNIKNQSNLQHQNYTISKDGVMNLKAKFYESAKTNDQKPYNLVAQHQPLKTRLSSHENYLFNNKNSQNALKVTLGNNSKSSESPASTVNNNYSSGYFSDSNNMGGGYYTGYSHHDDDVAASDL